MNYNIKLITKVYTANISSFYHQNYKQQEEKTMGVLKINCYCNEHQMQGILDYTEKHLTNADRISLTDIDKEFDGLRICIEFEVFMDTVKIKSAEVLDSEWDLLYEDTAVLNSRLYPIVNEYNRNHAELIKQSAQIRSEYIFN